MPPTTLIQVKERSIYWQNGRESTPPVTVADLPDRVSKYVAPIPDLPAALKRVAQAWSREPSAAIPGYPAQPAPEHRTTGVTLLHSPDLTDTEELLWLDLTAPTPEELASLGAILDLDAHTLEDAASPHERPKIIHLGSYSFLTAYFIARKHKNVQATRISAYMLPNIFITIHPDDTGVIDEIVSRWRQDPHLVEWGVSGLLQGLMDVMVDDQFDILESLDSDTDELSKQLFADKPDIRKLQQRTFVARGQLVTLHRIIPQTRDVVASILRQSRAEDWPPELCTYWEDVNDHSLRAAEWVDSLRDLVTSIFEASLALNDSRMNEVMKKLAAWAAIIAVPTAITGWFGMNIPYPGFSTTFGLVLCVVLIVASIAALLIAFKKQNWL